MLGLSELRAEFSRLSRQMQDDVTARRLVLALLVAAFGLVGLAVLRDITRHMGVHLPLEGMLSLTRDRALPELFMYAVEFTCAAACFYTWRRTRQRAFLFFTLLFGFITLDDSLSYHEALGGLIAARLHHIGIQSGAQDMGELVAWGIAGLLLLPPLGWCLLGLRKEELGIYLVFAVIFAGLVFFAVGMDVAHAASKIILSGHGRVAKVAGRVLGWFEDGGELVMVTVATCAAVLYARRTVTADR